MLDSIEIVVLQHNNSISMATATAVSMKLLIDSSKARRVLFAEASKECVDFLFHILSLPVAIIIRLLQEQGMEGSLPNLYKSLENLNDTYIQQGKNKDIFLKPAAPLPCSSVPLLPLGDTSAGKNFYSCTQCADYVSDDWRAACPQHNVGMSSEVMYVAPPPVNVAAEGGGLVKGVVTYMVMDNLEVKPMSTISSLALLNTFKVKEVGALEEKVVNLGMDEAIKLLKILLKSNNVLTELFCSVS